MHNHDYQTITETSDAIVEVCKTCKKKLVTKKGNRGRIDNAKWLKEHAADFAQPTGRTAKLFKQIYGSR